MEGPSKAEIAFEDRKDGSCGVSYVVQEPGKYPVVLCQPDLSDSVLLTDHAEDAQGLPSPALLFSPISLHPGGACPSSEPSPAPGAYPGMRLGVWLWPHHPTAVSLLTGCPSQVTTRSPSSSMTSTSQTAPSWCPWPPSQMMHAASRSPASRCVLGGGLSAKWKTGGSSRVASPCGQEFSSDLGRARW